MCLLFFFNDTATTEIYTLSLHDALPISLQDVRRGVLPAPDRRAEGRFHDLHDRAVRLWELRGCALRPRERPGRSEEHTSELQSRPHLVCRLLLGKKKTSQAIIHSAVTHD